MDKFVSFEPFDLCVEFPNPLKRKTILCIVCDGYQYHIGMAVVNPKDKYDPKIGSKIALKNAIKNLPKSERQIVWEDYFKHVEHRKVLSSFENIIFGGK